MADDSHETSPFLQNNFGPLRSENTLLECPVVGALPSELHGMFVRNGPNPQFDPIGRYHWFDGDGMVHGVHIEKGKASYRNRYVRTKGFELEREAGKALWSGLIEPPAFDNPHGPFKNAGNTALVYHDGRFLALWEGGPPHHLRVPSLETVGEFSYEEKLQHAFTAHPKVDPVSGAMHFFGYNFMPPFLTYSVAEPGKGLVHTAEIELPSPVMMHDFAMSSRFVLFMDLPVVFSLERAMQQLPPFFFDAERPSRFGILPKGASNEKIRWFEAPPCYVFHTANAWEEGNTVVLVACRTERTDVLGGGNASGQMQRSRETTPMLHRWRFDLDTGKCSEERLDERATEFPRVNDDRLGQQQRYAYAARVWESPECTMPLFSGLMKYDLRTGKAQEHLHGEGRFGGEGVYVPREGATSEDDGWVVTYVYDERENRSELVVVAAQDFTAPPVARVLLPNRVPYGFHGAWITAAQLATG